MQQRIPLTKRQLEALEWIAAYIAMHKVSPSVSELAAGLGVQEASGAYFANMLIKRGHAKRTPGHYRTLELIPERVRAA